MLEYPLTGLHVINYDKQNRFTFPKNMRRLLEINGLDLKLSEDALLFGEFEGKCLDSAGRLTMPHQDYKVMVGQGDCFQFFIDVLPDYNGRGYSRDLKAPYVGTYPVKINDVGRMVFPKEHMFQIERNVSKLKGIYMSYDVENNKFFFTQKPNCQYSSFEFLPIDKQNRVTIPDYFREIIPEGQYFLGGDLFKITLLHEKKEIDYEKVLDWWKKFLS